MDVLAVRGAIEEALKWVRAGKGPIVMELKTYRYRGHSMSDPAKYRTREEVQAMKDSSDCIDHAKRDLEALGVTEDELKAIDKEIRQIVVEAADFAEQSPEPDPEGAVHRRAGGNLLMPIELKMPALSPTMEEGTLAKWLVKEGDTVKSSGDILAEIETDKATMEFEAVDEGTIAQILVAEGTGRREGRRADRDAGRAEGEEAAARPRAARATPPTLSLSRRSPAGGQGQPADPRERHPAPDGDRARAISCRRRGRREGPASMRATPRCRKAPRW